jgi:predicted nucleic acid-binding Zn ribbon protein
VEALSGVLPRVLQRYGLHDRVAGWRAVEEWAEVVGTPIARHSRAASFRDGILLVEVEGSAWMHELGVLKRELVRRFHKHLGGPYVRELRLSLAHGHRTDGPGRGRA